MRIIKYSFSELSQARRKNELFFSSLQVVRTTGMRVKQTNITAQRGHKLKDIVQRHAMHVSYSEKY